jgi:hypothetical protein
MLAIHVIVTVKVKLNLMNSPYRYLKHFTRIVTNKLIGLNLIHEKLQLVNKSRIDIGWRT